MGGAFAIVETLKQIKKNIDFVLTICCLWLESAIRPLVPVNTIRYIQIDSNYRYDLQKVTLVSGSIYVYTLEAKIRISYRVLSVTAKRK